MPQGGESDSNGLALCCPRELGFLRSPLGSAEAPVWMLEFSDFSCPYCARFALETLPQLKEEYIDPGRVRLHFLPFPVHGEAAKLEAQAAFCAAAQSLFWEFQEAAFKYAKENGYPELGEGELASILASAGGNPDELLSCLAAGTYAEAVEEVIAIARELGVRGTPTFFVGNQVIPGAYPYQTFRGLLDRALKQG